MLIHGNLLQAGAESLSGHINHLSQLSTESKVVVSQHRNGQTGFNIQLSLDRGELSEEDAIAVVSREIKQLKETMDTAPETYVEIKEECAAKIAVLSEFMPKQMDVEEIKEVIAGVLAQLGLEKPEAKQKGIIMKNLMPLVKGKADGKLVNDVLATFFA